MKTLNLTDADRAEQWHVVYDVNQWRVMMGEASMGAFYSKARCKEFMQLNNIKAINHEPARWLADKT